MPLAVLHDREPETVVFPGPERTIQVVAMAMLLADYHYQLCYAPEK